MKTVVITGVSTGIGFAAVRVLIPKELQVFGSVRSKEDAVRLKKQFGEGYVPLLFDVTDPEGIGRAAAEVGKALDGEMLGALVNNAGITVAGPLNPSPGGTVSPAIGGESDRTDGSEPGISTAAGYGWPTQGAARTYCQHQFRRRKDGTAIHRSLLRFQIWPGRIFG